MLTAPRDDGPARIAGVLASLSGAIALLGLLLPDGLARYAAFGLFALLGPGSAIVARWRIEDEGIGWLVIAITLSLSLCCVIATVMIWIAEWHPTAAFALLAAVTLACGLPVAARRSTEDQR